ncbi:MAG: 6-phosphofructokinase, partial [Prosthecobacter sp.]|nr:6-phosphofructokinase [Prosthecobacter sp.]
LEVMGRHAGWIALYGGMAGGADIILLPEIPFHLDQVAQAIRKRDAAGHHSTLVVVAEGARLETGELLTKERVGAKGEDRLGGIGEFVAKHIEKATGKETRSCTLGHLQRGGAPTALDRILGVRFGAKAVDLIEQGSFGRMVSYQHYQVGDVSIEEAVNQLRLVNKDSEIVKAARAIGISFGDP